MFHGGGWLGAGGLDMGAVTMRERLECGGVGRARHVVLCGVLQMCLIWGHGPC